MDEQNGQAVTADCCEAKCAPETLRQRLEAQITRDQNRMIQIAKRIERAQSALHMLNGHPQFEIFYELLD